MTWAYSGSLRRVLALPSDCPAAASFAVVQGLLEFAAVVTRQGRPSRQGSSCLLEGTTGECPPWRPHKQAASMAIPDCMPRCAPAWVCSSIQPRGSRLCCMCRNSASQTVAASPMCKVETQTQQLVHTPAMESHCARVQPGEEHAPTRRAACPAVHSVIAGVPAACQAPHNYRSPSCPAPPDSSAYT